MHKKFTMKKIGQIPNNNNTGTQAIDRAMSILNCFDYQHQTWDAQELSTKLELTLATTKRIIKALESQNILKQIGKAGNYELGLRIFELGAVAHSRISLVEEAKEILQKLYDETKQTIRLVKVDGDEYLYIYNIENNDAFRIISPVGIRRPLLLGSLGKSILSIYPPPLLDRFLSEHRFTQYTMNTITDKSVYLHELASVREKGFATDKEEVYNGVCSVAAPIIGKDGLSIGGIAVVFPVLDFNENIMSEWGKLVRQGGINLSRRLMNKD
jgi:IclR family transcriptional regulator, KDG regulon repressor